MPFFSRRVGLGGGGEPIRLDAGSKMTGRVGGRDLGVLGVRQDSATGPDSADLFVARVATNVFEESSLGAHLHERQSATTAATTRSRAWTSAT